MPRIFFHSPNQELSQSDKLVIQSLRYHSGKTIIHKVRHTVSPGDVIFNFGDGGLPDYQEVRIINPKAAIMNMVDKVRFFTIAPPDTVPASTTTKDEATRWLAEGNKVVAHVNPRAARGEGLQIIEPGTSLPDAPLYTRFVNSVEEYRVICVGGRARYASKRHGVRFEKSIVPPPHVERVAERLCVAMGFQFAGLDVLDLGESALVCEANSAPLFTYAVAAAVAPYLGELL